MNHTISTNPFDLTYSESVVEAGPLWENHCHSLYEMIAVLEGDISVVLEGRCNRLNARQAILIPPITYHAVTANQAGSYQRVKALFDITAVPAVLRGCLEEKTCIPISFPAEQIDEFREIGTAENASFYEPLAHSLMIHLLYNVIRASSPPEPQGSNDFLKQIVPYIDKHLYEKITLDTLAAHTACSKSTVCHLFEEKMGISPKQYILQKKMAMANKLIREGVPPTQAAIQVGYNNYSAFYRAYRKFFRVTPSMPIT